MIYFLKSFEQKFQDHLLDTDFSSKIQILTDYQ